MNNDLFDSLKNALNDPIAISNVTNESMLQPMSYKTPNFDRYNKLTPALSDVVNEAYAEYFEGREESSISYEERSKFSQLLTHDLMLWSLKNGPTCQLIEDEEPYKVLKYGFIKVNYKVNEEEPVTIEINTSQASQILTESEEKTLYELNLDSAKNLLEKIMQANEEKKTTFVFKVESS